jgi:uncharacterized caspase-like protein
MADQFINGYALLIGVNENLNPEWELPVVEKDVKALREVLIHPERCGYREENVKVIVGKVIVGKESSRANILIALDWLAQKLKDDSSGNATAVVFYSGHGFRDNSMQPANYYLVPYDVQSEGFRASALRAEDFASAISDLKPQRLLVILDCCHAGGMDVKDLTTYAPSSIPSQIFMLPGKAVSQSEGAKGLELLSRGSGRAVLSSSQGQQQSYIRKDHAMSIFTYHLIEALTGHAQPGEGATEVLVSDLMSYVWRKVPESAKSEYGVSQEPDYQVSGNFPIALLLGGKGLAKGQTAPDPLSPIVSDQAKNTKVGAIFSANAQIRGDYVVHDKNIQGDEVRGDKLGGDKITVGNISGQGVAIGRGGRNTITTGVSVQELRQLFEPLLVLIQKSPTANKAEILKQTEELCQEVAKGTVADDRKIGELIDGLIRLVPDAVSYIAKIFSSPILGGIVGPVTKYVLDKIQRD